MNSSILRRIGGNKSEKESVRTGSRFVSIFRLTGFPAQLPIDWLSNLLLFLPSLAASVSLFPISKGTSVSMVKRFILNLSSELISRSQSGKHFEDIEIHLERARILSEDIRSDAIRLFYASILLAVVEDSHFKLESQVETLKATLRSDGVSYSALEYGQSDALEELSLSSPPTYQNSPLVTTRSLPALIPFTQSPLLHKEGSFLGFNAVDGTAVIFDRFSGLNFNSIIVGKSGSGKSFFAKVTILRERNCSGRCFVVDPLGEFIGPCLYAGGNSVDVFNDGLGLGSLTLSQLSPLRFHFLRFLGTALRLSESEKSDFRRNYSSHLADSPGQTVESFLKDLGLSSGISPSIPAGQHGIAGFNFVLKGSNPLSGTGKLTVFDLNAVPRDVLEDAISLICGMVFEHCKSAPGRKTLIVDEAWTVSRKRESAQSLSEIARHSRHFEMSLVLISQNFDDFLEESYGESLLNNCSSYYVFRHEKLSDRMLSYLEIEDRDLAFLSSSAPRVSGMGRCLFISSGMKIPVLLPADATEGEICRSDGGHSGSPYLFLSRLAERKLIEASSELAGR